MLVFNTKPVIPVENTAADNPASFCVHWRGDTIEGPFYAELQDPFEAAVAAVVAVCIHTRRYPSQAKNVVFVCVATKSCWEFTVRCEALDADTSESLKLQEAMNIAYGHQLVEHLIVVGHSPGTGTMTLNGHTLELGKAIVSGL